MYRIKRGSWTNSNDQSVGGCPSTKALSFDMAFVIGVSIGRNLFKQEFTLWELHIIRPFKQKFTCSMYLVASILNFSIKSLLSIGVFKQEFNQCEMVIIHVRILRTTWSWSPRSPRSPRPPVTIPIASNHVGWGPLGWHIPVPWWLSFGFLHFGKPKSLGNYIYLKF